MKSEGFFGLTSLMRPKKEVLWLGSEQEVPKLELGPLLSKIKFSSIHNCKKALFKSEFQVLVLSENAGWDSPSQAISKEIIAFLNLNPDVAVFFVPHDDENLAEKILAVLTVRAKTAAEVAGKKRGVEKKLARMKALVRFVQGLSGVKRIEDLMALLRQEVRVFSRVKEPILAYAKSQNELLLLFYQGSQLMQKVIPGMWPQQNKIRMNDVKDSQYLANIFGRPFAKLLTIPLKLRRKSTLDPLKVSAVLFLEHALQEEDLADFLDFVEERLFPISIALDRLLLEQDLNESSLLWERTFDGLQDPVVILDRDEQILRANKAFAENLRDVKSEDLQGANLKHNDRLYEIHSYPIQLAQNDLPTNIINHYVDVTLAHRLQNQMIQNEKMAALGHLAGHIAHELNNPLTGIRSLAQVLVQQTLDKEMLNKDLQEVEHAAERCQIIIRNLIEFSSGGLDQQQVRISANEIVRRTLPFLKTLISRFEVIMDLTDQDCQVLVEPHLIQQVIFNIIKNAAQAMGDQGRLTLRTEVRSREVGSAPEVLIRVGDTGGGIPSEIQNQMFDFFFTTKSPGQGTGIGLSMSKSIMERFHGKIEVSSQLGDGSEFTISLPCAEG